MKAKFIRNQDSKKSMNVGMERLRKRIEIFYDPYDSTIYEKEVKYIGKKLELILKEIDPAVIIGENQIFNSGTIKNLYGILLAEIATPLSNEKIADYINNHDYNGDIWDNIIWINVSNDPK